MILNESMFRCSHEAYLAAYCTQYHVGGAFELVISASETLEQESSYLRQEAFL
mgnify:CR=1 FL=1